MWQLTDHSGHCNHKYDKYNGDGTNDIDWEYRDIKYDNYAGKYRATEYDNHAGGGFGDNGYLHKRCIKYVNDAGAPGWDQSLSYRDMQTKY